MVNAQKIPETATSAGTAQPGAGRQSPDTPTAAAREKATVACCAGWQDAPWCFYSARLSSADRVQDLINALLLDVFIKARRRARGARLVFRLKLLFFVLNALRFDHAQELSAPVPATESSRSCSMRQKFRIWR